MHGPASGYLDGMSLQLDRSEVEAALRAEALRRGEEVADLRWEGDNPVMSIVSKGRSREEMTELGRAILEAAFAPLLQRALADSLRGAFKVTL